jgi:hypothetical protein
MTFEVIANAPSRCSRPPVGAMLREWRRGRSQLELALEAGVSARHLSFVETGRGSVCIPRVLRRESSISSSGARICSSASSGTPLATGDPALNALHEELASYPSGNPGPHLDSAFADLAVPLRVRRRQAELSFISTRTSFDKALDVTVAETFFPADRQTVGGLCAPHHGRPAISRSLLR